ncbi:MAG: NADH-quinone oxidoreductase subunit L [Candidatus Omnitrophica bacterium]|nr:NADH-quinone oxidoreductase subunit L [Candidatus Omnitrophota bacterium]
MKLLLTVIFFPILGSILVYILPKRYKAAASALILGIAFLFSLLLTAVFLKGKEILFSSHLNSWLSISFTADGLAVFMASLSLLVGFLIALYSIEYMRDYEEGGAFYFWMVLFLGSMTGLVFSANLLLLFCFWEITSVCSWRLIGFYRGEKDLKAADKAFLVTFFGASLFLIAIVLVYLNYGALELSVLKGVSLANLVAFLFLAGIISKSAQLPLQSWLPDAGVAPTPVTALLHAAVLVKIGIYAFARLFNLTFVSSPLFLNSAILVSVITIIVAAGSALVEKNMKRILAYSTISQLGYILLALALNTGISFKIALVYILAHSLAKAGLFLCAGIIEHKTGSKNINELGGLLKTMPYTATAYLLCAFSIIGIPPFLGFWPKLMVVLLSFKAGYLLAGTAAVIGALLTLFYLMRLFEGVFLGEAKIQAREDAGSFMVAVVLILGVLSLFLGLLVKLPLNLVNSLIK